MYVRGYRWDSTGLGGFQFMYGFNWYLSCFSWFSMYVRGFHLFCKGLGIFQFMFSGFGGFRQGLHWQQSRRRDQEVSFAMQMTTSALTEY
jgi:hypothetical protein